MVHFTGHYSNDLPQSILSLHTFRTMNTEHIPVIVIFSNKMLITVFSLSFCLSLVYSKWDIPSYHPECLQALMVSIFLGISFPLQIFVGKIVHRSHHLLIHSSVEKNTDESPKNVF